MWIVKIVTFVEYHPYLFLLFVLVIFGVIWFFWREHKRPSYKQKKELEQLLKGFDETRNAANDAQKKK